MEPNFQRLTADEAAALIHNGQWVACSGFTPAGSVKSVTKALGRRAKALQQSGEDFKINLLAGASSGDCVDGELSRNHALARRFPYQANKDLRLQINNGDVDYVDFHLSNFCQWVDQLPSLDWAVVEVADYTADGELVLTSSVGATPLFCQKAQRIILEHNTHHPKFIKGLHDIYAWQRPPERKPILLEKVEDRLGEFVVKVDPRKIAGVVSTCEPDNVLDFKEVNSTSQKIGEWVAEFFLQEMKCGRIPKSFLPVQSGVGNIANAVLKTMGEKNAIPPFAMYSEVVQNAVIDLMKQGRVYFASGTALAITNDYMQEVYDNWNFYKQRLILRSEDITNNPEIIRRIGLLSLNTAIEVDCFGHANSTHACGNNVINGIGGSGDFTRNAYISIFTLSSTNKNGHISGIVPFCSHVDHTEHDVQVIITENGIADLRGKSPMARAECIVENCAHPDYKPLLRDYLKLTQQGHIRHDLTHAFAFHKAFLETGDMRNCRFD